LAQKLHLQFKFTPAYLRRYCKPQKKSPNYEKQNQIAIANIFIARLQTAKKKHKIRKNKIKLQSGIRCSLPDCAPQKKPQQKQKGHKMLIATPKQKRTFQR
jgi:hypothetical protein